MKALQFAAGWNSVWILAYVLVLVLPGCAGFDITQTKLSVATHKDLQGTAALATKNGYPARGSVYSAIDAQLTACEQAINAALPGPLDNTPITGPIMAVELAAEGVGKIQGFPADVKINCAPFPVTVFPLPKLP